MTNFVPGGPNAGVAITLSMLTACGRTSRLPEAVMANSGAPAGVAMTSNVNGAAKVVPGVSVRVIEFEKSVDWPCGPSVTEVALNCAPMPDGTPVTDRL